MPPGLQRIVHRCLEKNPEQRFQSASDLAFGLEALSDSGMTSTTGAHAADGGTIAPAGRMRMLIVGLGVAIALCAAFVTHLWTRPPAIPKVSNYVQLTHDGQAKGIVGTEASRLYLFLANPSYQGMAEMSIAGGELRKISILPSSNDITLSLSPDASELLIVDGHGVPAKGPLSIVPVLGGSARRLGDLEGQDASWSADGLKIAYANGGDLFVTNTDGTESRRVISMKQPAVVFGPVFSPDGNHLRFNAQERLDRPSLLWEVSTDGKELHRLLPGFTNPPNSECCGRWMPDGKYYIFWSRGQIWAIPGSGGLFHSAVKPIQLTSSPLVLSAASPSQDGKKLFVVGQTFRGELDRYDAKSRQFVPALGGISAEYTDFSKDGQWVTYVAYPEGTLWRSRVDGSERLQLTYPPGYAMMPRWSPDGKQIVFHETYPDKVPKINIVSAEGGTPRPLLPDLAESQEDPNWSPDGGKMVFAGVSADEASEIRILDIATHQVTSVPGSKGLFSPRWSPDGRYIPAFSADLTRMLIFDFQSQKWSEVAKGTFSWLNFTKDGRYLLLLDTSGTGAVVKIRVSDFKQERMVDLKNFIPTGRYTNSLALAPDDSPLILRNAGTQDVYSLDWQNP
jgi:Tol biopolymer transport system component